MCSFPNLYSSSNSYWPSLVLSRVMVVSKVMTEGSKLHGVGRSAVLSSVSETLSSPQQVALEDSG